MKAVVWSKNGCILCDQAKMLLDMKNIPYEERNISSSPWSKEQLFEAVPNAKSVPQIFLDESYVGGFAELRRILQ